MITAHNDDQRIDFRIPVDFILNKYVNGRPYLCRASDLSRCGVRVHRVFEPENEESSIGLQFQLPGTDRVITCAGKVVHADDGEPSSGVVFTNVDPEHQAMIDDYILRNLDWSCLL